MIGGTLIWGYGLWWFAMAVLITARPMRARGMPFNLGWWAIPFRWGVRAGDAEACRGNPAGRDPQFRKSAGWVAGALLDHRGRADDPRRVAGRPFSPPPPEGAEPQVSR